MTRLLILTSLLLTAVACTQAPPVVPDSDAIRVERKPAPEDCEEIGTVEGRTTNAQAGFNEALEDLKHEAAHRGANYVHIGQSGAMGTSVRGVAYICR